MKHVDYLRHKAAISRMKFQKFMVGSLSKPEKFMPIKSDPDSSQKTKQGKSKHTVGVDVSIEDKSKGVEQ